MRPRIWIAGIVLVLLLLGLTVLLVVDFPVTRQPAQRSALGRQLIGAWVAVPPEESLQRSVLTFHPDGWATSWQRYGNQPPQEYYAKWHIEGSSVVYQETRKGLWGAAKQLLDAQPREKMKILSISDTELRLGQPGSPLVFRRGVADDE